MAHIDLSSYEPVNGTTNDGNPITAALQILQTLLNGLLDSTNISPTAGIPATAIQSYPTDPTKFLRGDNTWAVPGAGADGWSPVTATLTYTSADGHTFVAGTSVDLTGSIGAGYRLKLTQSSVVAYYIVTAISSTTITLYGGLNYTLANSAISAVSFSSSKAPFGFSTDPTGWTETLKDTTQRAQSSPAAGTWYNPGSLSLAVPIGAWDVVFKGSMAADKTASSAASEVFATLSAANNSESNTTMTAYAFTQTIGGTEEVGWAPFLTRDTIVVAAKTSLFANIKTTTASTSTILLGNGASVPTMIVARCAYL